MFGNASSSALLLGSEVEVFHCTSSQLVSSCEFARLWHLKFDSGALAWHASGELPPALTAVPAPDDVEVRLNATRDVLEYRSSFNYSQPL